MSTLKTNKIQAVTSQATAIQLEANNDVTFIGSGLASTGTTVRISNPNTSTLSTSTLDFFANNASRVQIKGSSGATVNSGVFTISTPNASGVMTDRLSIAANGDIVLSSNVISQTPLGISTGKAIAMAIVFGG